MNAPSADYRFQAPCCRSLASSRDRLASAPLALVEPGSRQAGVLDAQRDRWPLAGGSALPGGGAVRATVVRGPAGRVAGWPLLLSLVCRRAELWTTRMVMLDLIG